MYNAIFELVFKTYPSAEPAFFNTTIVTLSIAGPSCYLDESAIAALQSQYEPIELEAS